MKNELKLSNDYLKYVEIHQGYYKDNDLKQSQGYIDWTNYYLNQNEGFCAQYNIWSEKQKLVRIGIVGMIIKFLALKD